MIHIILLALILATTSAPAHAGWTMYAPGVQDPVMTNDETDEERVGRETKEEEYRKAAHDAEMATPKRGITPPNKPPRYTKEQLLQGKPYDGPTNVRGPRPGGHRRHLWREQTGFNTPAERTRYRMEIQRLNRELRKERAKPSPYGTPAHKITGRKRGI